MIGCGSLKDRAIGEQQPKTRTEAISDVKNSLSSLVNEVYRKEIRVVIEKRGIPVAALVSATDLERLVRWERERDERFAVIDRMRAALQVVPPEEIEREAERSVAAARERLRQRRHEVAARSA